MKLAFAALLTFAALTTAAHAQETFRSEDERQIEQCLIGATVPVDASTCVGAISETCIHRPAVQTTQTIVMCAARERTAWLALLNTYADRLRRSETASQRGLLEEHLTAGEQW